MPVGEDLWGGSGSRPQQYITTTWGADQNTGVTYLNPEYQPWLDSLNSSKWITKNPFSTEQDYLAAQQKGSNYIPWKDYSSLWNDWSSVVGDSGPKEMYLGYGEGIPQFKTANNLFSMGYSGGGWTGGSWGGGESGPSGDATWVDPSFSLRRYLTEAEAPGGWALSIDPYTGKVQYTISTHGEGGGFFGGLARDIGPIALAALGAYYLPGMLGGVGEFAGASLGAGDLATTMADIASISGTGAEVGSLGAWGAEQAADLALGGGNAVSMAVPSASAVGTNLSPLSSSVGAGGLEQTMADLGLGGQVASTTTTWPAVPDILNSTGNTLGMNTITSSPSWLDALKTSLTPTAGNGSLFGAGGILDSNKGLIQLGGGLYDLYAKNQISNAQQDLANKQNDLALAGLNANQANTKAAVDNINGLYAPGSPEWNLMHQTMQRQDAQAGRNSQFGSRATELAAKIAGIKSNALASVYSSAGQAGNGAYMNALNAANNANNLSSSSVQNQYGGLASLFSVLGSQNQESQGLSPQQTSQILRLLLAKQQP